MNQNEIKMKKIREIKEEMKIEIEENIKGDLE